MTSTTLVKTSCVTVLLSLFSLICLAQPSANFNAIPTTGCAPLVVNFSDLSTGNPTQWRWDLGNGTFSILQNPSVTYFNPGQYNVKLVVQNASGRDSIIRNQYITIYAQPTVNFTASTVAGCFPLTVNFTDQSIANNGVIDTWQWDFGDGTLSTQQNPTHIYTASGNYNVSLRVRNSNGCFKTITRAQYINIMEKPKAGFTNSISNSCTPPVSINFQNTSVGTGTLSYNWIFGDGGTSTQVNPTHVYSTSGVYTVRLIATNVNGCRDTITKVNVITVGNAQTRFTSPDSVCMTTNITINNTSTPVPASVSWDFGDGTTSTVLSPIKSYAAPGIYPIKLVCNYGSCKDSVTRNITVLPKPVSGFTASPIAACQAPLTVNFTNTSTDAITYLWNFGDGTTSTLPDPTHTYTALGSYTVRLTTTNAVGCTNQLVRTQYIKVLPPQASINNLPQEGCAPFSWTFTSAATTSEAIASYEWDFGDGTTSTQESPTHIFGEGTFNITLIITTVSGCRDTVVVPAGIRAGIPPEANFSATPREVCAEMAVAFTDLTTGTVTEWLWDFGDGGTSPLQNPNHTYTDTGYFTVQLISFNNGCPDTLVMVDYIHVNPPIAIYSTASNCSDPFTRTFTDRSIGADEWHWDFGDGTTSTIPSPVHTYLTPGTYTVSLVVRNWASGCEYTKTTTVQIISEHANFTANDTVVCRRDIVTFSSTGSNAANISSYQWTFGDGISGSGVALVHAYPQSGFYDVSLVITDIAGCKDTLVKPQYIRVNGPKANFASSVPGSCLLSSITFTDNSTTDGINPITRWIWKYGDGIIDTLSSGPFQHTYAAAGVYTVTLIVTDSSGCTDSIRRANILTISRPVANFNSLDTSTCPDRDVTFLNQSTGPNLTYTWYFGDGNTSTATSPVHHYMSNGNFTVKLVVVDQYGCTDSLTRSNYVSIRTPTANFTVSDSIGTCPPLVVDFTNTSQNFTSINWDFGDGTSSQSANPSHFYAIPGVYVSKLTVTGAGGCTSEKIINIVVRGPYGSFTYGGLSGCQPLHVNFVASTRDRTSFIWDFNDGSTLSTTDSIVSHTYTTPGFYVPKMILRDAGGCVVPIFGTDTIKVFGIGSSFDFNSQTMCNSGTVQFNNTTATNDTITSYHWNFGDGSSSTLENPSHHYSAPGIYYPQVIISSQTGCRDSMTSLTPVKIVATPQALINQSANGCVDLSVTFNGALAVADTSSMTWNWDFGNGHTATSINPPAEHYPTAGSYPIRLLVTNSSGCMDTVLSTVEAYAIPLVNAGLDTLICQGRGKMLQATGAVNYVWSPSTGLSCTHCANPVATPDSLRQYIVTGTTEHGCSSKDSVIIHVQYPFNMANGVGDTLCIGKSHRLNASGAHSYAWTPTTGLDNPTLANPLATPDVTTVYQVVGTDDKNCFTDTARIKVVVYNIPTIEAGDDKTINVGQTIDLVPKISADVIDVIWTPTSSGFRNTFPSLTVKPRETTTYTAKAVNGGGCSAIDQVTVNVICNGANIFIPNTFSPNGDGSNDIFYPRGSGVFSVKSIRVFSRWGEMVFERNNFMANDVASGWDGTYKGQKLNADVFVYIAEVKCENNTTLTFKGNVALIR